MRSDLTKNARLEMLNKKEESSIKSRGIGSCGHWSFPTTYPLCKNGGEASQDSGSNVQKFFFAAQNEDYNVSSCYAFQNSWLKTFTMQ